MYAKKYTKCAIFNIAIWKTTNASFLFTELLFPKGTELDIFLKRKRHK